MQSTAVDIHVPQVRDVEDYDETNGQATRDVPRYAQLDPTTSAYFRYASLIVLVT